MTPDDRFLDKVEIAADGCWLWTAGLSPGGYGQFYYEGRLGLAHRYALERKLGRKLEPGELACHTCDRRICVNMDHLYAGNRADNLADARKRGLWSPKMCSGPTGERHPQSILTDAQVADIRQRHECGETQSALSREFGVGRSTVRDIVRGWSRTADPVLQ